MAVFSVANMVQFNEAILNIASGDTIEIMAAVNSRSEIIMHTFSLFRKTGWFLRHITSE